MHKYIDLSKIPVFLTVAECMSFTEASYRLYSTQSSVSKTIAGLEMELGFPLFIRQNRKIALTKEGSYLYARLSNVMTNIDDILSEAKMIYEGGSGMLSIGTSGYTPKAPEFEKICSLFTVEYPSHEIELRYMNYTSLKRTLLEKKIDAILLNDQSLDMLKGCCLLPLFIGEPLLVYSSFEKTETDPKALSLTDFKNRKFVCIDPNIILEYYNYLVTTCKAYGFTPNITKYVSNLHEVVLYAGSSNLVTIFDRAIFPMINSDLRTLSIPFKEGMVQPLRSVLVWNSENQNPVLQEFIRLSEKTLEVQQEIIS